MRIDESVIEDIKNKTNIVDVISRYISVIKKGNNYVSVCPFHNDTNPSMNISVDKQIYKCFSCGAGGNVFSFVSEYEKISFIDAVRKVASYINYDLSGYSFEETKKEDPIKVKLLNIVKDASDYYNYTLLNTDNEGIKYLKSRGINEEIIEHFKLGYSNEDSSKLLKYLTKKGYTVEEIVEAGIGLNNNGFMDRFNGRVIFPLTDLNGNIVAFSGRRINDDKTSKYINSNENALFNKSECLYNFYEAKTYILQTKRVYIVEGFMDAIALYKSNIKNVVATMGVNLSKQHIRSLEKMNANIVLSLDSDDAGQNAMYKLVDTLSSNGLHVEVTRPSKIGKDLDEIFNEEGSLGVTNFIKNTCTINEFRFEYKLARTNLNNYLERSDLIRYVANLVDTQIRDKIEKENFIIMASERIGCNKELISENIDNLKRKVVKSLRVVETKNNNNRYYNAEIEIIKQMLFNKDAAYYYVTNLGYMLDNVNRSIATYIVDYYYKQLEWDGKKIIDSIGEENIKQAALKIYNDGGIASKFNKDVFDVIIRQKPLDIEIKELENQFKETYDLREKAIIMKQIMIVKQKLKGNKVKEEDN